MKPNARMPPPGFSFAALDTAAQSVLRHMVRVCCERMDLDACGTREEQISLILGLMEKGWLKLEVDHNTERDTLRWRMLVWEPIKQRYVDGRNISTEFAKALAEQIGH